MNLLSRRSVLAIAAVVDVALHSRSTPVGAKALAATGAEREFNATSTTAAIARTLRRDNKFMSCLLR